MQYTTWTNSKWETTEHALVLHIMESLFILSVEMFAVLEATSVISVV